MARVRHRGLPRSSDRDAALDIAVRGFWSRGYRVTSIADLVPAMGIAMRSLYAAFGDENKNSIFGLPAPFSPSKARISPREIRNDTPRTASSPPWRLVKPTAFSMRPRVTRPGS